MSSVTLKIKTDQGLKTLEIHSGKPLFILGRNGTGKSALVHAFVQQLGTRAIYLPGARPSYFDSESLSLTPASRRQLTTNLGHWNAQPDTRWKSLSGTSRNDKAIHDLASSETQYKVDAANTIILEGKDSTAVSKLQSRESPLDQANALLTQANLPVKGVIDDAELKATRDGSIYSIAKMSDGERTAFVLISEVVAAPADSVFVIDEPELHLHRAIVVPLINALMRANPEGIFLISTHELDLPVENANSTIALIRGCRWQDDAVAAWDVDVIEDAEQIPESIKVDIIGSRRKILFVEGTNSSLDSPLYALLFPAMSVRTRESCRDVERAVVGLRGTENIHRARAFGLIDNDGMTDRQISDFEAKGVYPLPVHAVESLYYSREVRAAVATRQGETLGCEASGMLTEAQRAGLTALDANGRMPHLASRIAQRQLRDILVQNLPDRDALINGGAQPISIVLQNNFPAELLRIQNLRNADDLDSIISRYPVRESGVLGAIAKALRFKDLYDYERAALARIGADNSLRESLRAKLGSLSPELC